MFLFRSCDRLLYLAIGYFTILPDPKSLLTVLVETGALMKTHLAHLPATHRSSNEVATALAGFVNGMSQLFLELQADSVSC